VAHELVMACITKKIRGYGFLAMMLQLPIVAVQRSRLLKGQRTFNVWFQKSNPSIRCRRWRYSIFALLTTIGFLESLLLDIHDSWVINGELTAETSGQ
jgi:hypothetical protein